VTIDWVVLDVGETLIDETRIWAAWAHAIGVSPLTFGAALGAVIAAGETHQNAFERLGATDWRRHAAAVEAALGGLQTVDLYPDALPAARAMQAGGHRVAIIANQPASHRDQLLAMGFAPDVIAMSEALGVSKPDDAFYRRALGLLGDPDPARVAHVGDRVDNDVVPALAAGMVAVHIRRGPWGYLHESPITAFRIRSLDELPRVLGV
jgi:FMN hydrolase / 5-amino-6-(5-phospho-D-ribitylamino)uracil phosphatase